MKWRDLMKIKETKFEVENCSILLMPCARSHPKKGLVPYMPVRWGVHQIPQHFADVWLVNVHQFIFAVKRVDERPIGWFFFDETSETNYTCLIAVRTVFSWTLNSLTCFSISVVGSFLIAVARAVSLLFGVFFFFFLFNPPLTLFLKNLFFSKKKKKKNFLSLSIQWTKKLWLSFIDFLCFLFLAHSYWAKF